MKQTVEIALPYKISTNSIYAGTHWTKRKSYKDLMRWALVPAISSINPITKGTLTFEFNFKNKPLDCSNCSFMVKMIEDVLVEHSILEDDSPKYIKKITIISQKAKKDVCILTLEEE
jgi:hypothetical protein